MHCRSRNHGHTGVFWAALAPFRVLMEVPAASDPPPCSFGSVMSVMSWTCALGDSAACAALMSFGFTTLHLFSVFVVTLSQDGIFAPTCEFKYSHPSDSSSFYTCAFEMSAVEASPRFLFETLVWMILWWQAAYGRRDDVCRVFLA